MSTHERINLSSGMIYEQSSLLSYFQSFLIRPLGARYQRKIELVLIFPPAALNHYHNLC